MKKEMLDRIRAAIDSGDAAGDPDQLGAPRRPVEIGEARLVPADLDRDKLIALFAERAASSGAEVHVVEGRAALKKEIRRILTDGADAAGDAGGGAGEGDGDAACRCTVALAVGGRLEKTRGFTGEDLLPEGVRAVRVGGDDRDSLFRLDAALTCVDLAVAETGSVLLFSGDCSPRCASLVAPLHIALLFPDQIVADLLDFADALEKKSGEPAAPGGATLITGPSKTADIETRLVTGVHGPGRVHLIVAVGFEAVCICRS